MFGLCIFQDEDELVLPLRPKKSALNGLCCLTFGLVVFMAGLVLASIYVYRYYFIPHVRSHLLSGFIPWFRYFWWQFVARCGDL